MARISGVDIPKQKRGIISLTYIFGIEKVVQKQFYQVLKLTKVKVEDWTDDETARIREAVGSFKIEGELRSEVQLNIKRLMDIGSYRGIRHRSGLLRVNEPKIIQERGKKEKTVATKESN